MKRILNNRFVLLTLTAFVMVTGAPAASIFSGSSGSLSASVSFDVDSDGNLTATLTNISAADVLVPADVLTAVFFDLAGDPMLMPHHRAVRAV